MSDQNTEDKQTGDEDRNLTPDVAWTDNTSPNGDLDLSSLEKEAREWDKASAQDMDKALEAI